MYQNADFYILDDPLSAVDAHVAEHLFTHVIGPNGLLSNTTCIVAVNTTAHLSLFDLVVKLKSDKQANRLDSYALDFRRQHRAFRAARFASRKRELFGAHDKPMLGDIK